MLSHRTYDRRFHGLVPKWLNVWIIDKGGRPIHPITGTPHGGVGAEVMKVLELPRNSADQTDNVIQPKLGDSDRNETKKTLAKRIINASLTRWDGAIRRRRRIHSIR